MSATPAEPTPAAPAEPTTPEPAAQAPAPPWGDDDANFDADKAKKLIADLRSDKEKLSAREVLTPDQKTKLAEYDRLVAASQTELEKAQAAAGEVAPLKSENLRLKVALEKGWVGDRASLVDRLKGETLEELRADADSLNELFPATGTTLPGPNPAQGAGGSNPETGAPPQLTQNDLSRMTPEQIVEARKDGRLNDLLGVR